MLHTFNPLVHSVEDYPYPRPGKMNANSVLKLLELTFHGVDEQARLCLLIYLICIVLSIVECQRTFTISVISRAFS